MRAACLFTTQTTKKKEEEEEEGGKNNKTEPGRPSVTHLPPHPTKIFPVAEMNVPAANSK